jgi:hypothetical protein
MEDLMRDRVSMRERDKLLAESYSSKTSFSEDWFRSSFRFLVITFVQEGS